MKILIGIYDPTKRQDVRQAIEQLAAQQRATVELVEVESRDEFWRKFKAHEFDCLILDHALPVTRITNLDSTFLRALDLAKQIAQSGYTGTHIAVGVNDSYLNSMLKHGSSHKALLSDPDLIAALALAAE